MKCILLVASMLMAVIFSLPRAKRAAFELPDGAQLIVDSINTGFSCDGLGHGYYADVTNNCQIFHVCVPSVLDNGDQTIYQYSFFCGNQTVFNQLTLTCAFQEEAIPCANAPDFYFVNDNIGIEDALFLTDDDVQRANQLIGGYGSRVQKK
ncbi:uncharacterized protein LOC143228138 [Tachypleus tridentatus]|uniref:uncharacterized protein LOC143228138 n=1 Tax=Tachypleus tridentatus TaxID=6853 RepID=UPI003FD2AB00